MSLPVKTRQLIELFLLFLRGIYGQIFLYDYLFFNKFDKFFLFGFSMNLIFLMTKIPVLFIYSISFLSIMQSGYYLFIFLMAFNVFIIHSFNFPKYQTTKIVKPSTQMINNSCLPFYLVQYLIVFSSSINPNNLLIQLQKRATPVFSSCFHANNLHQ